MRLGAGGPARAPLVSALFGGHLEPLQSVSSSVRPRGRPDRTRRRRERRDAEDAGRVVKAKLEAARAAAAKATRARTKKTDGTKPKTDRAGGKVLRPTAPAPPDGAGPGAPVGPRVSASMVPLRYPAGAHAHGGGAHVGGEGRAGPARAAGWLRLGCGPCRDLLRSAHWRDATGRYFSSLGQSARIGVALAGVPVQLVVSKSLLRSRPPGNDPPDRCPDCGAPGRVDED